MPELPEVETIRKELQGRIIGQTVQACTVLREDVIACPPSRTFCKEIKGERILSVGRRAKYLIIQVTHDKQLIVHLRLSGSISIASTESPYERFTRVAFRLDDCQMFFNEPRCLGRLHLVKNENDKHKPKGLCTLGLEPLVQEFDFNYLRTILKGRKAPIKSLLLDQRICAGVGNIYSDEALFRAGIRPFRRAHRITVKETHRLVKTLKDVLAIALEHFGTSVGDYVRTDGATGKFQDLLYVYGRENEPCRVCGTLIKVRKLGNRSTRYCPKCQK